MFNNYEKEALLYGFNEFCTEKQQFQSATSASYVRILEVYFDNLVINRIAKNNYIALFDEEKLKRVKELVKNNALRASFLNLLDFLYEEDFIEHETDYLRLKDRIVNLISGDIQKNDTKNQDFLTPKEIKNLFYYPFKYNNKDEQKIAPLVTALSFFCLYKQSDIFKLKLDDVDIENRTIKNIRHRDSSNLAEYIQMNDKFYTIMVEYLEYRNTFNTDSDALIIHQGKPIEMTGINAMFGVYKRNGNKEELNFKKIHCEILIQSMMHYLLISKGEEGLVNIFRLINKENRHFQYAFADYIETKRNSYLNTSFHMNNLDELLPTQSQKDNEFKKLKEDINNSLPPNFEEDKEGNEEETNFEEVLQNEWEFDMVIEPYSANNDISFRDLEDFEMGNTRNHEETKVTIQRLVRDSNIARKLKEHYEYRCQLCNYRLRKSDGSYIAECHHIQPYNKLHQGDDTTLNLIVLCPNCHTQFDDLYFAINPETYLVHCILEDDDYHLSEFDLNHKLDKKYLMHAWKLFNEKKAHLEMELSKS